MSSSTYAFNGYLSVDPQFGTTKTGKKVGSVSVPISRSKYNEQTRKYEQQGETLWVKASFWEEDAEALHGAAFTKGEQVILTANGAHVETYEAKDGTTGASLILEFATIGRVTRGRRAATGGYTPDEAYAPGARQTQTPPDNGWQGPLDSDAPSAGNYSDETPF